MNMQNFCFTGQKSWSIWWQMRPRKYGNFSLSLLGLVTLERTLFSWVYTGIKECKHQLDTLHKKTPVVVECQGREMTCFHSHISSTETLPTSFSCLLLLSPPLLVFLHFSSLSCFLSITKLWFWWGTHSWMLWLFSLQKAPHQHSLSLSLFLRFQKPS